MGEGVSGAEAREERLLVEEDAAADAEAEAFEERLAKQIHAAKSWLFASLLLTLFVALFSSVVTDANLLYAILGFLPTVIMILLYLWLLEGEYKEILFWFIPLAVTFLFLTVGPPLNDLSGKQLDIPVLAGVNLLLGYLILAVMVVFENWRAPDVATEADLEQFKPERLDKYIHTIEDKCKALNFVIGRVYRASNGGTRGMRDKIKVPSEWYNEFNAIKPEEVKEKKELPLEMLRRIRTRLGDLLKPEKELFTNAELHGLKHLARDRDGKDRVLDVLSVNDNDPVEDYYLGAMDFCKRIIAELEKL